MAGAPAGHLRRRRARGRPRAREAPCPCRPCPCPCRLRRLRRHSTHPRTYAPMTKGTKSGLFRECRQQRETCETRQPVGLMTRHLCCGRGRSTVPAVLSQEPAECTARQSRRDHPPSSMPGFRAVFVLPTASLSYLSAIQSHCIDDYSQSRACHTGPFSVKLRITLPVPDSLLYSRIQAWNLGSGRRRGH